MILHPSNTVLTVTVALAAATTLQPGRPEPTSSFTPAPLPFTRLELRPVDQGTGDINPVSTSLRWQPTDLRVPVNFDRVFKLSEVVDQGGAPPGMYPDQGGFVRFDAGVSAVFPWSSYVPSPQGDLAEIPAGTVFHIGLQPGRPGIDNTRTATSFRPGNFADLSVNLRAREPSPTGRPGSIWTDETYRRRRLSELIDSVERLAVR